MRLNPAKPSGCFSHERPIAWCPEGRYLPERPSFIADPMFHAGAYYVQEASSMVLHTLVGSVLDKLPDAPVVLDLCAAPGGKSTLLLSALPSGSLLVSNEVIRSRVPVLIENLQRWGNPHVVITQNDPSDFASLPSVFDMIVIDAPCSGEGLWRKNKKAIEGWSMELVKHCSLRQNRIVGDAIGALKPGGVLIYATCTYNPSENEEQVRNIQQQFGLEPMPIPDKNLMGFVRVTSYQDVPVSALHAYPHRVEGEGFFIAMMRKPGKLSEGQANLPSVKTLPKAETGLLAPWLNQDAFFMRRGNEYAAVPTLHAPFIHLLEQKLKVEVAGVNMGQLVHGELLPHHALALSTWCSADIPGIPLSLESARIFLKKEVFRMDNLPDPGWYRAMYQNLALGWVKVLPNRINNYFPKHLRVIKDIIE